MQIAIQKNSRCFEVGWQVFLRTAYNNTRFAFEVEKIAGKLRETYKRRECIYIGGEGYRTMLFLFLHAFLTFSVTTDRSQHLEISQLDDTRIITSK